MEKIFLKIPNNWISEILKGFSGRARFPEPSTRLFPPPLTFP
jgi:hypothetical protein